MITLGELVGQPSPWRCKKQRHDTKEDADAHIQSLRMYASKLREDLTLHSYRCDACQRWHVGHARDTDQTGDRSS